MKLFKKIGFVKGNGTQRQLSRYAFANVVPGKFTITDSNSSIWMVNRNFLQLFQQKYLSNMDPQPNKENFMVSFTDDAVQSVELIDVKGRRMPANTSMPGSCVMKVQTKSAPNTGIYFLKIRTEGDVDIKTRKIIIA